MKIIIILLFFTILSCNSHKPGFLGNNLFIMQGDRTNSQIIVFCLNSDASGCYSGDFIIPNQKNVYDEHIVDIANHSKYVYVTTYDSKNSLTQYWIIDKRFNEKKESLRGIQSNYVKGPFNYSDAETFLRSNFQ